MRSRRLTTVDAAFRLICVHEVGVVTFDDVLLAAFFFFFDGVVEVEAANAALSTDGTPVKV